MFFNRYTLIFLALMLFSQSSRILADPGEWLMSTAMMLPGIIIGLSFHEAAHGFASYRLGDPTPKEQGRLTLNPLAHIDPVGLVCLLFAGFGWGVPVQINPSYYKNRRRDQLIVALAGVVTNFIVAFIVMGIIKVILTASPEFAYSGMGSGIIMMLRYIVYINLVLMVFNLLPVPPLDGWNVITQIFNLEQTDFYWKVRDKGVWILMLLIIFNVTGTILTPCVSALYNFLINIYF